MQQLLDDMSFALRSFKKSKRTVLLIILTLGLGIGANSAIFSMVWHVLYAPLPFEDGERLVKIETNHPVIGQSDAPASVQTMLDYRHQSQTLDQVFEYHQMSFTLLGHGDPSFVLTGVVGWNYFDILGFQPILGRSFLPGEDEPGAEPLILLSNRYWLEKFGGDANVVGTTLEMNNRAHRVIGVLPPMPAYPMDNDIWIATSTCPFRGSDAVINNRAQPFVQVYGKLKPDVEMQQAGADLNSIAQRLVAQYPDSYPPEQGLSVSLTSLRDEMAGDSSRVFYLLLGLTALVLIIACANVANLNLARMSTRSQELAIREALGASPGRIARAVLTESIMLALAGAVLGIGIAYAGINALADFATRYTSLASEVRMDGTVLGFSLLVAVLTGLISGSAAALQRRNLNRALKEGGGNVTVSSTGTRLRQILLVVQFALAFMILCSAALITMSLYRLTGENPGFSTERILSVDLTLNFTTFNSNVRREQFLRYLESELVGNSQISSVAASSTVPLEDRPTQSTLIRFENHASIANNQDIAIFATTVSKDYFTTLRIPLLQGRHFTDADDLNSPRVYIVNQALVDRYFPTENPIGKRISGNGGSTWGEIVGVAADARTMALDSEAVPTVYGAYLQFPEIQFAINRLNLFIETSDTGEATRTLIADTIHQFDPEQAVTGMRPLEDIRDLWLSTPRLITQLVSLFALLACVITLTGVIGVIAYTISLRFKEIGIRVALGAHSGIIRNLLTRQGVVLALTGLIIGSVIMLLAAPSLIALLYQTSPADPLIYGVTALIIMIIALIAIAFPTRRATRINITQALRDQ